VRRRWCVAILATVAGWLAWSPSPALAYEDQFTLGVGAGYAHAIGGSNNDPGHLVGIGGDLSASMGLGPAWALRMRAGYSHHPGSPNANLFTGAGELLYLIDVIEVVPYAGLGLGVIAGKAGAVDGAGASGHVVLGCDYLLSRSFALELDLRGALAVPTEPATAYFTALVAGVFLFDG
jgi:hypothetical protein